MTARAVDEPPPSRLEAIGLAAIVVIAALARLPNLPARGRFDADQGHDMFVLLDMTRGVLPLLGPRTSVGEFHHGAFYYYLLSPAALLSGADPVAVTAWIAVLGIAAVALTWWLARQVAGPVAGLVAAILMAVSPAGVEQSTFIWNPNPIPAFAALSLGAAWRGHRTARARWWAVAIGAAAAVVQLHVLGLVFLLGIVGIAALAWWRGDAGARFAIGQGLVGGLGIALVLFLPLLVHELQTGFLETHRVLDYLAEGDPGGGDPISSVLLFTLLRVVGWPLIGLVTDVPGLAAVVAAVVVAIAGWLVLRAPEPGRTAARWLAGLLGWTVLALGLAAPSLQRVVAGLPNDHYHAFADPMIFTLIGIAAALVARATLPRATSLRPTSLPGFAAGPALVVTGTALLAIVGWLRWPAPDPDGGWDAARAAGVRIDAAAGGGEVALLGLPEFKLADGIGFPIGRAGSALGAIDDPADAVVVACDRLFEGAIGLPCGGPAEDRYVRDRLSTAVDPLPFAISRFDASPRTAISIYTPR